MGNDGNDQKEKEFIRKRCLNCKNWFRVALSFAMAKWYCDVHCSLLYNRAKLKKCPHCAYVIPRKARGKHNTPRVVIRTEECLQCGDKLVFSKYIPNAYGKMFCNYLCYARHYRKKPKHCPNCGRVIPKSTWGGARHFKDTDYENRN